MWPRVNGKAETADDYASQNAAKVMRILQDRAGSASGQRAQHPVARMAYTWLGPYELEVLVPARPRMLLRRPRRT